ncbi:MAG: hydroxyacylglutathione hydrolase [Verrucomicrobiota bacterium]|jgi:hydroxyacylglutathione hydrolase
MSLIFERILTDGIAAISYLIGDDEEGSAAVIDPRPDVEIYLELARKNGVAITHIFETHIHADLVSGSRELADRTGTAKIYASSEGGAEYGFSVEPVKDGDEFSFAGLKLTARHSPGHTPEHICYVAAEEDHPECPWGVFTGDSLFVNSAGRPDLLGRDADKLASQLYDTLWDLYGKLDDGVIIHPSHGSGSPCGADIGDRLESTIGFEKRFNPYYQRNDRQAFVEYALSTPPPEPTYYKRMKKVNAAGPEVLGRLPVIPALPPKVFQERVEKKDAQLVDTRSMLAFGGGHIEGALNIAASPILSIWAGWLLDPAKPILLVLESDGEVEKIAQLFVRTGYTNFAGYLVGGMRAWQNAGYPLRELPQMTVHELQNSRNGLQLLDVRGPAEWKNGRIPGAKHIFLPQLQQRANELDRERPVLVYCATGYRASLAASVLQREGFPDVRNLPGSLHAWKAAKFPVEK